MRLTRPMLAVGGTFIIEAPDKFARSAFESKLRVPISEALTRRMGQPTQIAVTLQEKHPKLPRRPQGEARPRPRPRDRRQPPTRPSSSNAPRSSRRRASSTPRAPLRTSTPEGAGRRAPESVPAQNPPSLFDTAAFRPGEPLRPGRQFVSETQTPTGERAAARASPIEDAGTRPAKPSSSRNSTRPPRIRSSVPPRSRTSCRPAETEPPPAPRWEEHAPEPPGEELERVLTEWPRRARRAGRQGAWCVPAGRAPALRRPRPRPPGRDHQARGRRAAPASRPSTGSGASTRATTSTPS